MANYATSADILDSALFDCNEPLNGTSDYEAQALTALNRGYQMLWMGGAEIDPSLREEWTWLRSTTPAVLILNPAFVGTVGVTNNSATITFSSAPAMSVTGRFFKTDLNADLFKISSHTAGNATATLDSVYTGPTNATEGYKVFQVDYALPTDVLRIISPMRVYRELNRFVNGIDQPQLEQHWPLSDTGSGIPQAYAQIGISTIRFSHYGSDTADDYMRVDFDYLQKPADLTDSAASVPLVPFEWRRILADYVCARIMVAKGDNRADGFALQFLGGVKAMARENRHRLQVGGFEPGHLFPRPGDALDQILRTDSGGIIG